MKITRYLFIVMFLIAAAHAQIIPSPHYFFERLQFQKKISDVQKNFRNLLPLTVDENTNKLYAKYKDDYLLFTFDTTINKYGKVLLLFSKEDSALRMIEYFVTTFNENEREAMEQLAERLWQETSQRFGEPDVDKNLLFMGKVRKWKINNTDVRLIKITSGGSVVMLTYSQVK